MITLILPIYFHNNVNEKFLSVLLRCAASPRDGDSANSMKQTRVYFKITPKLCKDDEDYMRAESLAANLDRKKLLLSGQRLEHCLVVNGVYLKI